MSERDLFSRDCSPAELDAADFLFATALSTPASDIAASNTPENDMLASNTPARDMTASKTHASDMAASKTHASSLPWGDFPPENLPATNFPSSLFSTSEYMEFIGCEQAGIDMASRLQTGCFPAAYFPGGGWGKVKLEQPLEQ
jgi:hypothetical protein